MKVMGNGRFASITVLAGVFALIGAAPHAGLSLNDDSRLWVEGTSTVRSYTCTAGALESDLVPTAAETATLPVPRLVRSARVTIDVAALDCANGTMNKHMRKALRMDEHPRITFDLDAYTMQGGAAVLDGTLTMAGEVRPVSIAATVVEEDGGLVRVTAEHRLNMTEWGIEPPSLMLGTMKVHDPVTVHFDVTLNR